MDSRVDFEYYRACGSSNPTSIETKLGILLIGGAEGNRSGENEATRWFLQRADGGNYLVLRTKGIGKQADWICDNYRDWVNSADELSIDSR
jgi:hypothetical protein